MTEAGVDSKESSKDKVKKLLISSTFLKILIKADYLTLNAKKTLNFLQNAFIELLIFYYFHWKCYISIKTHVSGYAIKRVLS